MTGVATVAMLRHLWYLSEENVGFSYFDDLFDTDVKELMVQAMKEQPGSADRPSAYSKIPLPTATTTSTADLVTKKTAILHHPGLPTSFLKERPRTWP